MYSPDKGVCSASFITMHVPAARAGASFQACINKGKFQGIICPTTPIGSSRVYAKKSPSTMINYIIIRVHFGFLLVENRNLLEGRHTADVISLTISDISAANGVLCFL